MAALESEDRFVLEKTGDLESIKALALESGLEDGTFDKTVVAYGCFANGEMVGCAALKHDDDSYTVEWLAVSEKLRGNGLGSMLVQKIEDEARARGAERVWALARAPRFFEKVGFRRSTMSESGGVRMSNCLLCSQYRKSCNPAVMVKDL